MKKVIENAKKVTEAQVKKIVANEEASKSQKMKDLFDLGMTIKEIAGALEVRYNFVYNVLSNHIVVNGIEVEKKAASGKKDEIIKLHLAGKTNKEIQAELKANYNYVFNVIKAYKKSLELNGQGTAVTTEGGEA